MNATRSPTAVVTQPSGALCRIAERSRFGGAPFLFPMRAPPISSRSAQTRQACGVWRASPPLGRLFCCFCLATTSGHSCSQEKQPKKVCSGLTSQGFQKSFGARADKRVHRLFTPRYTTRHTTELHRERHRSAVFPAGYGRLSPTPVRVCLALVAVRRCRHAQVFFLAASEDCIGTAAFVLPAPQERQFRTALVANWQPHISRLASFPVYLQIGRVIRQHISLHAAQEVHVRAGELVIHCHYSGKEKSGCSFLIQKLHTFLHRLSLHLSHPTGTRNTVSLATTLHS